MISLDTATYNTLSRKAFFVLIHIQRVEDSLKFWLEWLFPDGDVTMESLEKERQRNERATLGSLIKKLEERIEVTPDFETLLSLFLNNRNLFIHNLRKTEWLTDEDEAIKKLNSFLDELICQALELDRLIFQGIWLWKEASGFTTRWDEHFASDPEYADLLSKGADAISKVFKKKDNNN